MTDRKDKTEARGVDSAPASAPAKKEIRGTAHRDNEKGKDFNSQTRKDEDQ